MKYQIEMSMIISENNNSCWFLRESSSSNRIFDTSLTLKKCILNVEIFLTLILDFFKYTRTNYTYVLKAVITY